MHTFVHALKLKSKKARELCSVIKMTKNTAVTTHLRTFFSAIQHSPSASVLQVKISIKGDSLNFPGNLPTEGDVRSSFLFL